MSSSLRLVTLKLHELMSGRQVLPRLEELNRTQWMSRDELLVLQRDKLQRLVNYAYQHVPYYQRLFDQVRFHPDDLSKDWAALRKFPILTKDIIRENFDDLLTTEPRRRHQMSRKTTSGSTGHPLIFMQDNTFRDYVAVDVQRHMGWAGWQLGDPQALIWGASLEIDLKQQLRTRLVDWVWGRVSINAFLLNDEIMTGFAQQVQRRRARILFGYATSLYCFAQFVRQSPYQGMTFDGIFSSAEQLPPVVRQFIEETFQCKVFNRYASLELGGIACECAAHTGLHVSVENNYVEILDPEGHPAAPGQMGDIIVTNLNNLGMPFIRYSIGDLGTWDMGEGCPCGRAAPLLASVQGRVVDTFKTRDGRIAWAGFAGAGYSPLAHPSIRQFQVVQKSLDLMVVRLVRTGEVPQTVLDTLTQTIHTAFGDNVDVQFEFPDKIPALPSGKHRYAVSEVQE